LQIALDMRALQSAFAQKIGAAASFSTTWMRTEKKPRQRKPTRLENAD
jgi:hypothetical protein